MRSRLRSPLRWLSAVMGFLMVLSVASVLESPLLMAAAPVTSAVFLLAPAIGIFKHDETVVERANVRLEALEITRNDTDRSGTTRFRLVLVNESAIDAEGFRIRLLVPDDVAPTDTRTRPLGSLYVGTLGTNWFVDSTLDATAITFRSAAGHAGGVESFTARSWHDLADLLLPSQTYPYDVELDYQVSGGNVKPTLGRLRLRADD